MARRCRICGKQGQYGARVSHAHNVTKVKRLPNLRRVRAIINGEVKRIYVCAKCLKAGKVERAVRGRD